MPIYEYRCNCGAEKDAVLPYEKADQTQLCECGEVMQRKVSVSNFAVKQYGKQMALDSLNARGGGFPEGRDKAPAQARVAAGLGRPKKTIW